MTKKEQKFKQLVDAYHKNLYRYAYWLTGQKSVAEDIIQETYLRAWKSIDQLRDINAAKPWLITILRRENARLYERKRFDYVDGVELDHLPGKGGELGLSPEVWALESQLKVLPVKYREPLLLQAIDGYTMEEISHILGIPSKTVATRIHRARSRLRKELKESSDRQSSVGEVKPGGEPQ